MTRSRQAVEDFADAALEADEVGGGGVGEGAELVEVAAGAEGRPLASDGDEEPLVGLRDRQGLEQPVAHLHAEGVAHVRPSQLDVELVAVALDGDRWSRWSGPIVHRRGLAPLGELRAGLQRRVDGRFRDQARAHRPVTGAEEQCERPGRQRRRGTGVGDGGEIHVVAHHEVDQLEDLRRRRVPAGAPDDDARRGRQPRGGHSANATLGRPAAHRPGAPLRRAAGRSAR